MTDLFDYARYQRPSGPRGGDTSEAALAVIAKPSSTIRANVRSVIASNGSHGATGDEIAQALGMEKYAVRPRTSELRAANEIVDSGRRRPSLSGVSAIVWVLPEHVPANEQEGGAQ